MSGNSNFSVDERYDYLLNIVVPYLKEQEFYDMYEMLSWHIDCDVHFIHDCKNQKMKFLYKKMTKWDHVVIGLKPFLDFVNKRKLI